MPYIIARVFQEPLPAEHGVCSALGTVRSDRTKNARGSCHPACGMEAAASSEPLCHSAMLGRGLGAPRGVQPAVGRQPTPMLAVAEPKATPEAVEGCCFPSSHQCFSI